MLLAFEIIFDLVESKDGDFSKRESLQMKANTDVNSGENARFKT